jgi:xanthine dehydrogenase accessory factor
MLFGDHLVVVRGGGDLGSGAVASLHKAGFPVVVLEVPSPLAIRRTVSFATAVDDGEITIEGIRGVRVSSAAEAVQVAGGGRVAVLVAPTLPEFPVAPGVIVDARMAKRSIDTTPSDAALVVALGPGFRVGRDCDVVIETMRGHRLGRVLWDGEAIPDTGVPGRVGGETAKRVVRATRQGVVRWRVSIGDVVDSGDRLGTVGDEAVTAPLGGVVRGLISEGFEATEGLKICDIDPRAEPAACFEVSDKARLVGAGVLEAVLVHLGRSAS